MYIIQFKHFTILLQIILSSCKDTQKFVYFAVGFQNLIFQSVANYHCGCPPLAGNAPAALRSDRVHCRLDELHACKVKQNFGRVNTCHFAKLPVS